MNNGEITRRRMSFGIGGAGNIREQLTRHFLTKFVLQC
jgi:hypothetical protein